MATFTINNSPIHEQMTITRVYGYVTSSYACGYHTGVDFVRVGGGNPLLYSCVSGTVVNTINSSSQALGTQVVIQADNGYYWRYCHMILNSIQVSVGQRVDINTPVGTLGATGNVTGPHLHLEVSGSPNWSCGAGFIDPCSQLGIEDAVGNIINYDGEAPGPGPGPEPPGPTPEDPTPIGPFYHRLFNNKWFWSTAPGYTGTLNDTTDLEKKQENAKYIWNYLKDNNWTLESASVVIGAMDLVSTLNSGYRTTTGPQGLFGLLGWRYWEFTNWVDAGRRVGS